MARKTIANLRAILGLDSKQFNRGIDKTGKKTRTFKKQLGGVSSALRGMVGPLAAAFSVVGITRFASATLSSADAIRKLSARTGVATGTIQELNHAFDLAGVGQERMNQGLLIFGKRLGKARGDTGAMVEGLRKVDVSLLEAVRSSGSTTEALDKIFDAMAKARNEAERLAIADAAFGEAGLKMASAFEDGADSFRKAREQARELGLVISEDLLRNAEKTNDAYTTASKSIGVQLKNAFLALTPAITTALNQITSFVSELNEANRIADRFGERLPERLVIMQTKLDDINERIKTLREQLEDPIETPANLLFGRADELGKLEKERVALKEKINLLKQILDERAKQGKSSKKVVIDFEKETGAVKETRAAAKNFTDELRDIAVVSSRLASDPIPMLDPANIKESAAALKPIVNNTKKMVDLADELSKRFDYEGQFNKEVTRLQQLLSIGLISTKTFDRAMQEAIERAGSNFSDFSDEAEDSMNKISRVALSVQGALENGFTRAFDNIIQKSFELREVVSQVLSTIASAVFRGLVATPISGAITGAIGNIFSGGGASGPIDLMPQFAGGGRITGPSIVGERGPELFVPDTVGTIVPNHEIGQGSVSLNQNFNIDARGSDDPAAVERAVTRGLARHAPEIVRASVESVRDGRRRDPNFFK